MRIARSVPPERRPVLRFLEVALGAGYPADRINHFRGSILECVGARRSPAATAVPEVERNTPYLQTRPVESSRRQRLRG
jgi:hypothetical protein